jgi:hypothetical protein
MLKKPYHYKKTLVYHSKYGLRAAYEVYININKKVRFPKALGGVHYGGGQGCSPQDVARWQLLVVGMKLLLWW